MLVTTCLSWQRRPTYSIQPLWGVLDLGLDVSLGLPLFTYAPGMGILNRRPDAVRHWNLFTVRTGDVRPLELPTGALPPPGI